MSMRSRREEELYEINLDTACYFCNGLFETIPRTDEFFEGDKLKLQSIRAYSLEQSVVHLLSLLGDEKNRPFWAYKDLQPHIKNLFTLFLEKTLFTIDNYH